MSSGLQTGEGAVSGAGYVRNTETQARAAERQSAGTDAGFAGASWLQHYGGGAELPAGG